MKRLILIGLLLLVTVTADSQPRRRRIAPAVAGNTALDTTNLEAYYKLDEAIAHGNRADSKGGFTLTDDADNIAYETGKLGNAARGYFVASTGLLYNADLNVSLSYGQNQMVAFWAKPDSLPNRTDWVGGGLGAGVRLEGAIYRIESVARDSANSQTYLSSDTIAVVGHWYFVVMWYTAGTWYLQVNDAQIVSVAENGIKPHYFMLFTANADGCWSAVDEVSVWKRILTAAERTKLYNGGTPLAYPFGN